jgi:hypothetical protein
MVQRMCTLILLFKVLATHPLLLLMNRDERYGRPSTPPELLPDRPILAPRDLRAGGTWIGVNAAGMVIALSNRHVGSEDPERRSRGLLVLDLLASHDPLEAAARLKDELAARAYNPFNLVMADGRSASFARSEGVRTSLSIAPVTAGVHALANGDLDDPSDARVRRALTLMGLPPPLDVEAAKGKLIAAARDHGNGGEALCRHGTEAGTVSSTLIALGRDAHRPPLLLHAAGPPGETPFEDLSPLLSQLIRAGGGQRRRGR